MTVAALGAAWRRSTTRPQRRVTASPEYNGAVVQCGCEHAWCGVRMAAMRAVGAVWMGELG